MLFTRCPGCQTTFRITADTLRVANGAVRCGSCATVFSAYSGLRQDALAEGMRQHDEFLSPTLQSEELAGIEEIEAPLLEGQAGESPEPNDDAAPAGGHASDAADAGIAQDGVAATTAAKPSEEELPPESLEGVEPDTAVKPDHAAALPASADTGPAHAPTQAASGKLHFETPVDEWSLLLSEIENSVDTESADADGEAATEFGPAADTEDEEDAAQGPTLADDAEGPELWNVGEPFSFGTWDPEDAPAAVESPAAHDQLAAEAGHEAADEAVRDTTPEDDTGAEPAISAEEIDATLSAGPDPDIVAALEAGLGQTPPRAERSRLWSIGSAVLLALLALQLLHHYRAPLATQPVVGPALQSAYELLGIELRPEWHLGQYEITQWAATASPGGSGAGNLHITAQIRNAGPTAQPYPSIQLELKDRWESVIGSRIFRPGEYLAPGFDARGFMAAGATVPADLAVVDPGLDASGFELDVCLETDAGRMSCAADRVFE